MEHLKTGLKTEILFNLGIYMRLEHYSLKLMYTHFIMNVPRNVGEIMGNLMSVSRRQVFLCLFILDYCYTYCNQGL